MANPNMVKGAPSVNPSGRPLEDIAFKRICRNAVDQYVIKAWVNEVMTLSENWVKCSEYLANYGYGKPSQSVEVTGDVNIVLSELVDRVRGMTDDQILALANSDK